MAEKIRSFMVRGLAVITVVLTYALGNVGTQVLSVAGISAVGGTATATPANAWRRFRHRRFRRRWWYARQAKPPSLSRCQTRRAWHRYALSAQGTRCRVGQPGWRRAGRKGQVCIIVRGMRVPFRGAKCAL